MGSLYLQKNTLILCASRLGRVCTTRLMFLSATYCTSGWLAWASEMSGGASFLQMLLMVSALLMGSMYMRMIFTADRTTAGFWWLRRGDTRSMMFSASLGSPGTYLDRLSRMNTWPHSVHSFSAASSFCSTAEVTSNTSLPLDSWISFSAATALATTVGLASESRSRTPSMKPCCFTMEGEMSYSLATHRAAVLRTYGSSSPSAFFSGGARYSVILSTRMQPIVRMARARMSGLGCSLSFTNALTAMMVRSGLLFA